MAAPATANSTTPTSSNSTTPAPPPPPPPSNSSTPNPPILPLPPGPNGNLPTATLIGLIVGVGLGGILVLVGVCFFFYMRNRRRRQDFYGGSSLDDKEDPPQNWQQNAPSPTQNKLNKLQKPTPPGVASNSPLSPLHILSKTKAPSVANGSEKPLSPSPVSLGLSHCTFTYDELAMATDGFSNANLLGQGGFGYVHKGVLPNGKVVAVKQLKAESRQGEREFQAEVETISRVHHRHLVSLVGYSISGDERMLVYEFVPNNTLEYHLLGKGRPTMSWSNRMKIALGSAKGLAYLHEDCQPKIIHRDIKASNILLDFNFEAKVADFGLAKFYMDNDTHVSTRVMGTFGYLAPEYASSGKLTEKSDVFSFGVVLLEFITGRRPIDIAHSFADDSMVDWARPLLAQALDTGNFDVIVDANLNNDFDTGEMTRMIACAAACIRYSARLRPRMSQIVRALEGNISLDQLHDGIAPGYSSAFSPGSKDYDCQYKDDLKKFKKLALETQELGSSEYSGSTSESGPHPSNSSSDHQQTTREMEMGLMKKDT